MARMVGIATSLNNFSFDRCLAALATRAEELMKVKMTEEPSSWRSVRWCAFGLGLGKEGNMFEACIAMGTFEAFWVEPE